MLIAPIIYLDPNLGFIGVKAFAGAILGGFGSIPGAIVGGMLLGVIENLSGYFFNAGIKQVSTYILLILVLVIRPSGFFGAAPIRKGVMARPGAARLRGCALLVVAGCACWSCRASPTTTSSTSWRACSSTCWWRSA